MIEKKSILQQIRDKETDLTIDIEAVARDTELTVSMARKDAEAIVSRAEQESAADAANAKARALEQLGLEIRALKERSVSEAAEVRKKADERTPQAIEKIVRAVSLKH